MFRNITHHLQRWQNADLITPEQLGNILEFEKARKAGRLTRDLGLVGIFAIILGMISLVASNWDAITPTWKLAGHFILNSGVAYIMLRIDGTTHPFRKDMALALLAGLFLGFIALIGQIFQLHGDIHTTLLFWLVICTPMIWHYGRTYIIAMLWLTVTVITFYLNIAIYFDKTPEYFWVVASLIAFYLPPILLAVSRSTLLQKYKDGFARAFAHSGIYLPAFFANIALFLFYDSHRITSNIGQILCFTIGLVGIFLLFRPKPPHWPQQYLRCYLLASSILIATPFIVSLHHDLIPLVLFLLYWIFLAWLGNHFHLDNLVTWAIRLIILRLFIAYLEIFGSLMTTGLGLIASGVLLLLLLRYMNYLVNFGRKLLIYDPR